MFRHRKYRTSLSGNTFGVGIITDKGKILADERSVYKPLSGMGIVPRDAAQHHTINAVNVLKNALLKAKLKIKNIDIIAVALGAGMPPCLGVGTTLARYLSLKYNKPLIGVCHQIAHIEIGKLMTGANDPVVTYLSGGNSQVITFVEGKYRVAGETEDLPLGNAIDCLARELDIPIPYGPNFDKTAIEGEWIDLPYIVKGMDVSFSGLLTEAIRRFKEGAKLKDVCYSFQETCFAMLTEVTERALAHTDKNEVLLVGGVAAAPRLKEMMTEMCKEREAKCYVVPRKYSGDQGVMIAWVGILAYKSGQVTGIENSGIRPKWRTDEVEITWL